MDTMNRNRMTNRQKNRPREPRDVYSESLITRTITLPINAVSSNIHQTLESVVAKEIEGKCIVEGFVKTGSVKLITHSSGEVKGVNVRFDVVLKCLTCFPVAGMLLNCKADEITKAGIRASSVDESPSPFIVYVARDHHYDSEYFGSIKENATFIVRVIGQRFELNDKFVGVLAELVTPKERKVATKPRLVLESP